MKRKADRPHQSTTTPSSSTSTYELLPPPPAEKAPKISTRRESGRPIKKPSKDLPESPALNEVYF